MSSGFVSSGTVDKPIERDEAWLEAQKDIDARRKQNDAVQERGKSLYDVLQANKGKLHGGSVSCTPSLRFG